MWQDKMQLSVGVTEIMKGVFLNDRSHDTRIARAGPGLRCRSFIHQCPSGNGMNERAVPDARASLRAQLDT